MSYRGIQGDERGQDFVPTHGQRVREEISHVPDAANVLHWELASSNPILEPMKTHVAGLRHFGLDGPIGKAHGDFIIAMNRRGRQRLSKVREYLAFKICDLRRSKRVPIFGLLYGGADDGNACGVDGDGGIEELRVVGAGEMMKRPSHAAGVGS
jgi:hypothetical protein